MLFRCPPSESALALPPRPTLQSLLEMVAGGAASMDELQQRLETELAALEVGCLLSWNTLCP